MNIATKNDASNAGLGIFYSAKKARHKINFTFFAPITGMLFANHQRFQLKYNL